MYVIDDLGDEFKLNSEKFKSFHKRVFHVATSPDLHPDTTPPLIIESTQQVRVKISLSAFSISSTPLGVAYYYFYTLFYNLVSRPTYAYLD